MNRLEAIPAALGARRVIIGRSKRSGSPSATCPRRGGWRPVVRPTWFCPRRPTLEREAQGRLLAEEHAAREVALKAEQATPEYHERVAAEEAERERDDLIDMAALLNGARGRHYSRSSRTTRYAAELGLTSSEHVGEDGKLTFFGAVLAYAHAALDLEPDDADIAEIMPGIREEIVTHRSEISAAATQLSLFELRAAEGNEREFERALALRQMYSGYPDLVTLRPPRDDIRTSWRDQLTAAS